MPEPPRSRNCPNRSEHHDQHWDLDYRSWHEWARKMKRTHVQHQCQECGLWVIWEPKEAADA